MYSSPNRRPYGIADGFELKIEIVLVVNVLDLDETPQKITPPLSSISH